MNGRNMPGFTAETSLYKTSWYYQSVAMRGYSSGEQRVITQLRAEGTEPGRCCCGSGDSQRCTSPMVCPPGCKMSCECGPGYVIADCFCGPKGGGALTNVGALSSLGGSMGGFVF